MFTHQLSYIPDPLPDSSSVIQQSFDCWRMGDEGSTRHNAFSSHWFIKGTNPGHLTLILAGHFTLILAVTTSPSSFLCCKRNFIVWKDIVFSITHLPGLIRSHYRAIFSILFIRNPKTGGFVDLRALCTTEHWHQPTRPKTLALWEHKRSKSLFNKICKSSL